MSKPASASLDLFSAVGATRYALSGSRAACAAGAATAKATSVASAAPVRLPMCSPPEGYVTSGATARRPLRLRGNVSLGPGVRRLGCPLHDVRDAALRNGEKHRNRDDRARPAGDAQRAVGSGARRADRGVRGGPRGSGGALRRADVDARERLLLGRQPRRVLGRRAADPQAPRDRRALPPAVPHDRRARQADAVRGQRARARRRARSGARVRPDRGARGRAVRDAGDQRRRLPVHDHGADLPQRRAQEDERAAVARRADHGRGGRADRDRQPRRASNRVRRCRAGLGGSAGGEVARDDAARQGRDVPPAGHGVRRRARVPAGAALARVLDRGHPGGREGVLREARPGLDRPVSARVAILRGRTSDRTAGGGRGAEALGALLSDAPARVGTPEPPRARRYEDDLRDSRAAIAAAGAALEAALEAGEYPVLLASDCSICLSTLPALARREPAAWVVWLDAHGDFDPRRVVMSDGRDLDPAERDELDRAGVSVVPPAGVADAVRGRRVFLHLDFDILDPSVMPAGVPAPGGLSADQLRALLAELAGAAEPIGVELTALESPEHAALLADVVAPVLRP